MTWFDRYILAPVAPRAALSRMKAQRQVRAYYEAAGTSQYRKKRTDRSSANANNARGAQEIRITARHLDENYDIASGILDVLVAATVGTGIWPEPQILFTDGTPATELNAQLLKLFEDWRFRPEVTWQHDYFGLQRLMARSYFRDGEVFGNRVLGIAQTINHGTIVPYSIEALETDFIPYDLNSDVPQIRQGIETNTWGRPVAYHVYKNHPGDSSGWLRGYTGAGNTKRVSADTFLHIAHRKRLHQLRGVSVFATIANRLEGIKAIDEYEMVASQIAASMSAYIKKGSPDNYKEPAPTDDQSQSGSGRRNMTFEAGLIFDDLEEGEEIGTIKTTRPNNELIPFRDAHLRAAACGVGVSNSAASKNYNGTYSAQRQELVESYQNYQMAAAPLIYSGCQPIWEGFVDSAIAARLVALPGSIDRDTLWDCTHTGPQMPWIDPESEMQAQVLAMQWKLTSRSRVIRKSGANPEQIRLERARDAAADAASGDSVTEAPDPESDVSKAMRRNRRLG